MEYGQYRLPEKLSDCIRLALADMRKVRKTKNMYLRMDTVQVISGDTCSVCMAGAIFNKTLKGPLVNIYFTDNLRQLVSSEKEYDMLRAIDYIRTGCLEDAFRSLNIIFQKDEIRTYQHLAGAVSYLVTGYVDPHYSNYTLAKDSTYLKVADLLEKYGY